MNDRHPSGAMTTPASASEAAAAPYASYGTGEAQYGDLTTYGGYDATGFPTGGTATATFAADPLFGSLPGQDTGGYDVTGAYDTGAYDTTQWSTGGGPIVDHDAYAAPQHTGYGTGAYGTGSYDTGGYDTTAWTADHQRSAAGQEQSPAEPPRATDTGATGQWDTGAWSPPDQSGNPADRTQQWDWGTQTFDTGTFATGTFHTGAFDGGTLDTGAYDATQWNSDGSPQDPSPSPENGTADDRSASEEPGPYEDAAATGELPTVPALLEGQEEVTPAPRIPAARAASRSGSRSRRRQPAKRSALMTIAVPSACVMSVAGIAAASVGMTGGDAETTASAADADDPAAAPVKPSTANNKLDTQLTSLAAGADDFADRASRTQERIDLKAEQALERRRAAEEAARKERLRPKFALPVAQHGLSAYYGQAGINWMSVHSGIDFPVSYGTTVMASTDGTVRTQYNAAYGNMMILTAKDGTETWYCHLSGYQVPSGTTVKAGDAIASSGDSGNSTGPHLHFEVRPAGGSAIDPLSWLRSHGLDPQ
ncbi:Peptidase [Streptomyces ambofaciens ATCC 23877]|uniref:Peptidase n=1 Tax=Streptomyces ambofaciens (strain ATCC 23877 / 3486 / DSM 40053 / JCM 4204 / NBRC 12836 / NRRL B-2516) TaxID=278992 RepID=A0A0K2AXA4_STRA7|nr:M23 family metallopeptidase [Streptomyces ambofaciens]AKZ57659.1 Peptidase [Streptomyces ambofaciens ATCC 23877]